MNNLILQFVRFFSEFCLLETYSKFSLNFTPKVANIKMAEIWRFNLNCSLFSLGNVKFRTNLKWGLICCQFLSKHIQDFNFLFIRFNEFKLLNFFNICNHSLELWNILIFVDSTFCTIRNFGLFSCLWFIIHSFLHLCALNFY